ncbi:hypothetical protein SLA2020_387890 [Shorea laevis]
MHRAGRVPGRNRTRERRLQLQSGGKRKGELEENGATHKIHTQKGSEEGHEELREKSGNDSDIEKRKGDRATRQPQQEEVFGARGQKKGEREKAGARAKGIRKK